MELERRFPTAPIPMRQTRSGKAARLVGYAAVFDDEYRPIGGKYVEKIAPGAFTRTLKENPDVRALFNHDTSALLGRTASGTLKLRQDDIGLAFDLWLPDTRDGRAVSVLVERGDITGCSIGFSVVEERMDVRKDGVLVCTLLDVDLYEISPAVTFPAYGKTQVELIRSRLIRYRSRL